MAFHMKRKSYQKMPPKEEKRNNENAHGIELECPICLELPVKPVFQCSNGHLICKLCHSKVLICPVCRTKLDQGKPLRNLTAEQFLENLNNNSSTSYRENLRPRRSSVAGPSIPCTNVANGCNQQYKTNGEVIQHQKTCKYRLVFCPDMRCPRKVPMSNLFVHINDDHPSDDFTKLQKASVNFSLVIKPANYRDETFWKPAVMQMGHTKFFRECRRTKEGQWYFWVYVEGSSEDANQYTATIKLFDSRKHEVVSFNTCSVLSLDVNPKEVSNYPVMTVQDPVIQSIEYNGKLSFFVEIVRK